MTRLPDVTEGYTTAPLFSKSYSTGYIFRSANDTLRDIFPPAPSGSTETPLISPRKRERAHSGAAEDVEMALDEEHAGTFSLPSDVTTLGRPMKPLRRTPRNFTTRTQTLPSDTAKNSERKATSDATTKEEKDWSVPDSPGNTASFEPMILS